MLETTTRQPRPSLIPQLSVYVLRNPPIFATPPRGEIEGDLLRKSLLFATSRAGVAISDAVSKLNSRSQIPRSFTPRTTSPQPSTHLCHQLVKDLAGFSPA